MAGVVRHGHHHDNWGTVAVWPARRQAILLQNDSLNVDVIVDIVRWQFPLWRSHPSRKSTAVLTIFRGE
jgi:hypothetical protein